MLRSRSAQSLLALVLLIGGMIFMIGITMAFVAGSSVDSTYGYQDSVIADAAATSGADDALLQLDRNPAFASSDYSLVVGSTTATVSVTQNSPSTNLITIASQATVSGHGGKIKVILTKNPTTGQITITSWQAV